MSDYNQLEANLEPPEDKPITYCEWCDAPLYEGDDYYELDGGKVCTDCIEQCKHTLDAEEIDFEEDDCNEE